MPFTFGLNSFIYSLYTHSLEHEIKKNNNVPKHIGLILDGNRRGARSMGIDIASGYKRGSDKLEEVLDWCWDIGIKVVSVWIFSTENFSRSEEEVVAIMKLAEKNAIKIRNDPRVHNEGIQVRFTGEIDLLPDSLQAEIKETESATSHYSNYILNVCVAYGGRAEITNAVRKIARSVQQGKLELDDITEDLIETHLYTYGLPDPDLIIRTSGEIRMSGFLLWQGTYSELYFADIFWPLFRKIDLLRAIRTFQQRKRNFGK